MLNASAQKPKLKLGRHYSRQPKMHLTFDFQAAEIKFCILIRASKIKGIDQLVHRKYCFSLQVISPAMLCTAEHIFLVHICIYIIIISLKNALHTLHKVWTILQNKNWFSTYPMFCTAEHIFLLHICINIICQTLCKL